MAPRRRRRRTKPTPAQINRNVGDAVKDTTTPGAATGYAFDAEDRLFWDFESTHLFDVSNDDARDLRNMLKIDGKARSLEQVLTLPLRAAPWEIRPAPGDKGEAADIRDQLSTRLDLVLDQMTAAVVYRKAFFEVTWDLDAEGRETITALDYRPPASCDAAWDRNGRTQGFRQRIPMLPGEILSSQLKGLNTGYVYIKDTRSFIYTHGQHREPIVGVSDLDVCLWAHQTRRQVLFLLFQFLENQSLPKVIVYGAGPAEAEANAEAVSQLKSSSVLPMSRGNTDPSMRMFDILESSGQGAAQFLETLRYLESQMSQSVLAAFLDLAPGVAAGGGGSYALSVDQSEFFLASRQAVATEMANAVTAGVLRPLTILRHGPNAAIPTLSIGPLSRQQTDRALEMLQKMVASPADVPKGFVDALLVATAAHVGLDPSQVQQFVEAEPDKDRREVETVDGDRARVGRAARRAAQLVHRVERGETAADVVAAA